MTFKEKPDLSHVRILGPNNEAYIKGKRLKVVLYLNNIYWLIMQKLSKAVIKPIKKINFKAKSVSYQILRMERG